jgi:hypothetical protein
MSRLRRQFIWLPICFALVLLVLISTAPMSRDEIDDIIDAKFGALAVGASRQEVETVLGSPDAIGMPSVGQQSIFWHISGQNNERVGVVVHFDRDGRVCKKVRLDESGIAKAVRSWLRWKKTN